mmetsp:Transcript_28708/g.92421  ORF Transcript_28708/g.92421 Transcript_28708/m.92421 type:complete len:217 (-) Transcript_28708:888-1538(-)
MRESVRRRSLVRGGPLWFAVSPSLSHRRYSLSREFTHALPDQQEKKAERVVSQWPLLFAFFFDIVVVVLEDVVVLVVEVVGDLPVVGVVGDGVGVVILEEVQDGAGDGSGCDGDDEGDADGGELGLWGTGGADPGGYDAGGDAAEEGGEAVEVEDATGVVHVEFMLDEGLDAGEADGGDGAGGRAEEEGAEGADGPVGRRTDADAAGEGRVLDMDR